MTGRTVTTSATFRRWRGMVADSPTWAASDCKAFAQQVASVALGREPRHRSNLEWEEATALLDAFRDRGPIPLDPASVAAGLAWLRSHGWRDVFRYRAPDMLGTGAPYLRGAPGYLGARETFETIRAAADGFTYCGGWRDSGGRALVPQYLVTVGELEACAYWRSSWQAVRFEGAEPGGFTMRASLAEIRRAAGR